MARVMRRIEEGFRFQDQRDALQTFLNMCFGHANIAQGVDSGNVTITSNNLSGFTYCINGYVYSVSYGLSASAIASTGMSTVASGYTRLFAVTLNSAGSLVIFAGSQVSNDVSAYIGSIPASVCVIALYKISMGSTSAFGVGSHSFASAAPHEHWDVAFVPQGVILSE